MDRPYRLEYYIHHGQDHYAIMRTGEGIICEGENQHEMLKLVEAANEAALQEQGDRGR